MLTLEMRREPSEPIQAGDVVSVETIAEAKEIVEQADAGVKFADVWRGSFGVAMWTKRGGWEE